MKEEINVEEFLNSKGVIMPDGTPLLFSIKEVKGLFSNQDALGRGVERGTDNLDITTQKLDDQNPHL